MSGYYPKGVPDIEDVGLTTIWSSFMDMADDKLKSGIAKILATLLQEQTDEKTLLDFVSLHLFRVVLLNGESVWCNIYGVEYEDLDVYTVEGTYNGYSFLCHTFEHSVTKLVGKLFKVQPKNIAEIFINNMTEEGQRLGLFPMMRGHPYVINVKNNTDKTVVDVELFNSDKYNVENHELFSKDGRSLTKDGVSISCDHTTYEIMLSCCQVQPFNVIMTTVVASDSKQIVEANIIPITLLMHDANIDDSSLFSPISLKKSNDFTVSNDYSTFYSFTPYIVNGGTSFIIDELPPNASLKFNFWCKGIERSVDSDTEPRVVTYDSSEPSFGAPYLITVENETDEIVKDYELFAHHKYLNSIEKQATNFDSCGQGTRLGVKVKGVYSSYVYLMNSMAFGNITGKIGRTFISFQGKERPDMKIQVVQYSDSGNKVSSFELPLIAVDGDGDTSAYINEDSYQLNGYFAIVINELLPHVPMTMYFYPSFDGPIIRVIPKTEIDA